MIVTIIHKLLLLFVEEHGHLPKHLHVFADNCWRENKVQIQFKENLIIMDAVKKIYKILTLVYVFRMVSFYSWSNLSSENNKLLANMVLAFHGGGVKVLRMYI